MQLLSVLLGAAIAFGTSYFFWRKSMVADQQKRRLDTIVRLLALVYSIIPYTRSLLYAKTGGLQAVRQIRSDPTTEVMAIAGLLFGELSPLVQQLHDKIGDIHARPVESTEADDFIKMAAEIQSLVNQLAERIAQIAVDEGLDQGPTKGRLLKLKSRRITPSELDQKTV